LIVAQFLGDIAGMLEIFAIALGLVLLHRASKEAPARLLKAAGWVLIVGGIAVGVCTSWYWVSYQAAGDFDRASSWQSRMESGSQIWPGMHGGRMHRGGSGVP
jgi:hypothetical protein